MPTINCHGSNPQKTRILHASTCLTMSVICHHSSYHSATLQSTTFHSVYHPVQIYQQQHTLCLVEKSAKAGGCYHPIHHHEHVSEHILEIMRKLSAKLHLLR